MTAIVRADSRATSDFGKPEDSQTDCPRYMLDVLVVHDFLDLLHRYDFAAGGQDRDSVFDLENWLVGKGCEGAPGEVGNDFANGCFFALGDFVGGLENVLVDVEGGSHEEGC